MPANRTPVFNARRQWRPYHPNIRRAVDRQLQVNERQAQNNAVPLEIRQNDTIRRQKEKLTKKSLTIARLQVVNQTQQINMAHRELAHIALRNQWKTEMKTQQVLMNQQNQVIAKQNRAIHRLRRHLSRIPEVCQNYHCGALEYQVKTETQPVTSSPTSPQLPDISSTEDWIKELEANGWTSPVYVPETSPTHIPTPDTEEHSPWPPQDVRLVTLAKWWTDHTRGSDPLGVVLSGQTRPETYTGCGTAAQQTLETDDNGPQD